MSDTAPELPPAERLRVQRAVACNDCSSIPKVPRAGETVIDARGEYQIMHNGVKVFTDTHYGVYNQQVISLLRGHHEPQEEFAFHEVMQSFSPGSTMLELGSFWGYYSLWFLSTVPQSRAYLVEPLDHGLNSGRRNFALNGREGTFVRAAVSDVSGPTTEVELWPGTTVDVPLKTVDELMAEHNIRELSVLHADIQGAEVRMLKGAAEALRSRRISWLFISTHGENVHQRCQQILREHGYFIVADHTPGESYSVDGLIVASAKKRRCIHVSRRISTTSVTSKLRAMARVRLLEPLGLKPRTA